jgi:putative restriction endonuclease
MIDRYKAAFSKLRTDVNSKTWSPITFYRAPHKPFLLLSVMDLIAQNIIQINFIEFNADLADTFDLYWVNVIGKEKASSPVYPFYHLKSSKFWHLIPVPGKEETLAAITSISSVNQLQQLVLGAKLDDQLFDLLLNERTRDQLRRVLIETYFAPDVRPKLIEVGQIASESFEYSRELLDRLRGRFRLKEVPERDEQYHVESRSTAFRRLVVQAYNHTCAICSIRIITPEGYTVVEAAHIVPWSMSRNDDPRNGMALCKLHHWTFDQGLVGVTPSYEITVSPVVSNNAETAAPLSSLNGQKIELPPDEFLWPAHQALDWHLKEIFRSEVPPRLL